MQGESPVRASAAGLRSRLEQSRSMLVDAVAALDEEGFRRRSNPSTWSAAGVMAHLLEMERILMEWAQAALARSDFAATPVTDDDRNAHARLAQRMAVPQLVHGLLARRRDTVRLLDSLSEQHLTRPLRHPDWGALTVAALFERTAEHEEEHAGQIQAHQLELAATAS